ncbi:hypothetical protein J6590_066254 [Homalodisca vitripennis]|nr:hypothetical protein J6590_066254 [Homalodisca vitripennis]
MTLPPIAAYRNPPSPTLQQTPEPYPTQTSGSSLKPKALKTRLKRFLVSQAFYNAGEFLAFDWETAQLED